MIVISFSAKYEDRVSIYLKNTAFKEEGIQFSFEEHPEGSNNSKCCWILKPRFNKDINYILSSLREMKMIMGVDDLEFSYCSSLKEFFTQYNSRYGSVPWFKV